MSTEVLRIDKGDESMLVNTSESGDVIFTNTLSSGSLHGNRSVTVRLNEDDVRKLQAALTTYLETRATKYVVGDIVYEPNYYKRAAEVISILEDRVTYGAPYRIRFIDQDPGQPPTDYFSADQLVLVTKASDRKDLNK